MDTKLEKILETVETVTWRGCMTRNFAVNFSPPNYSYSNFYGPTQLVHLVHSIPSSFWLNCSSVAV